MVLPSAPRSRVTRQPAGGPPRWWAETPELPPGVFRKFQRLVHQQAGIFLAEQKRELVRGRLGQIIRKRGLASFSEYYRLVVSDPSGSELIGLLDAISTNQTSFWREPGHFRFLLDELLPAWGKDRRNGLAWRLWSAGCSTGEEPYTLAMVLRERLPESEVRRGAILATDLNTQVLAQAQRGIYAADRLAPLPPEWRRRYFLRGTGRWQGYVRVKPSLRQLVSFQRLNLMDRLPFEAELDIIFCRNVMIYFDKATQAELINRFYECLKPGGFLFIGHSESLCNLRHRFTYFQPTIYRK